MNTTEQKGEGAEDTRELTPQAEQDVPQSPGPDFPTKEEPVVARFRIAEEEPEVLSKEDLEDDNPIVEEDEDDYIEDDEDEDGLDGLEDDDDDSGWE